MITSLFLIPTVLFGIMFVWMQIYLRFTNELHSKLVNCYVWVWCDFECTNGVWEVDGVWICVCVCMTMMEESIGSTRSIAFCLLRSTKLRLARPPLLLFNGSGHAQRQHYVFDVVLFCGSYIIIGFCPWLLI